MASSNSAESPSAAPWRGTDRPFEDMCACGPDPDVFHVREAGCRALVEEQVSCAVTSTPPARPLLAMRDTGETRSQPNQCQCGV